MKNKILLLVLMLNILPFGFAQFVIQEKLNLKKNEGFLPRREVLNEIIPSNEINGDNFIHVEDFYSIDSNTMVLQCLKNGQFSDFFFCVVEKDNDSYKASQSNMNRAYQTGTKDFIRLNDKIHRFRYEKKSNQIMFFADELMDSKIEENKIPFHTQLFDKNVLSFEIQFFEQADKLFAIFKSVENKKEKINILTFSNDNLNLVNKQQIEIQAGSIFRLDAIKNNRNLNLYTENVDGSKRIASLYKVDQEGNYFQTGENINIEGLTDRIYFYKNKGLLFLCRYSLNSDESWTNTIFEAGNSFNLLNKTKIPVETIYKSYFEKSFKEVNTKVFLMYNFGFHEILQDDKQNTYIFEYRIKRAESNFYGVCDIFLTKINASNEFVFSTPIKRSLRGAGQGELFPNFIITDEEVTFEDIELDKRFENGIYQENYNFSQFGVLKKDPLRIKVSINQKDGEITRTVLN